MAKIEASVIIDRPVEEVWKFVTDWSNVAKWDVEVLELKQTSSGPLGVGATVELREKHFAPYSGRVIEDDTNRKFSLEATSGYAKGSIITFSMETTEGKTKFTNISDFKLSGFLKLVGPFITPGARRYRVASLANVKRILESEAKP